MFAQIDPQFFVEEVNTELRVSHRLPIVLHPWSLAFGGKFHAMHILKLDVYGP